MVEFVGVYFMFPETKGPSLEEIAFIFDGPAACVGNISDVMDETKPAAVHDDRCQASEL